MGGYSPHLALPGQADNPRSFRGAAGTGYELLRVARPGLLPSVLLR